MAKHDKRNQGTKRDKNGETIYERIEKRHTDHSYMRIGLYKYSRQFGHENICDVHMEKPAFSNYGDNSAVESRDRKTVKVWGWGWAFFSGPNDSIRMIKRTNRTRVEMDEYDRYRNVDPDLDVGEGGNGYVITVGNWPQVMPGPYVYSSKIHVWLFGPLLLEGSAYGSLFMELTGPFRRDMVFRPFQLYGSSYHPGTEKFIPDWTPQPPWDQPLTEEQREEMTKQGVPRDEKYWEKLVVDTYNLRAKAIYPAFLPKDAKRWEWTVEAYERNVTRYNAQRRKG